MTKVAISRASTLTLALTTLLACGGRPGPAGPTPAIGRASPDGISEIRIRRTMGGWRSGADYTVTLRRDRPSEYRGEAQVARLGKYAAAMPPALFDSLAAILQATPMLQERPKVARWTGSPYTVCVDVPGASIEVVDDGERIRQYDDCGEGRFADLYILPVERVVERLDWRKH